MFSSLASILSLYTDPTKKEGKKKKNTPNFHIYIYIIIIYIYIENKWPAVQ